MAVKVECVSGVDDATIAEADTIGVKDGHLVVSRRVSRPSTKVLAFYAPGQWVSARVIEGTS